MEYSCNRCDDPTKPAKQSTTDPLKERSKPGTVGRNCKGFMTVKVYDLFKTKNCDISIESIAIIYDSLPSVHLEAHDVSWKYVCV